MKIRRLNIPDLQRNEIVYDYYWRLYNFMYASHADGKFKNIPLLEKTCHYLSDHKIKLPDEYIEGFIQEYNRPFPSIKTEEERQWALRNIQPDPDYIPRDIFNDFFELGAKTAEAFKTWEHIIENLPLFEKYFTGGQENLTHRQKAIILYFKGQSLTREQARIQGGKNFEKAMDSVNDVSKTYKPISAKEIEAVLPYLHDNPEALEKAKIKLSQLK
ncbi:MAG: hypothetical protein JW723_12310 [Bacteroidales bacterium]|nr:hypothetical protein [Bacteroidales bacterium]